MIWLAAYAAVLGSLGLLWAVDPNVLYIGRDGMLSLWLARMQAEWGAPGQLTIQNPFQGMASMMLPVNPWWIPASLPAVYFASKAGVIASFALYHTEFTASVLALGRALGFSAAYGFAASVWLTVLLFPPLNYVFGLHAWLGSAPVYAHTLALGNAMAAILLILGRVADNAPRALAVKPALVALFSVVLFAYVFASPFYNAGMLAGYGLLFGAIIAATPGLRPRAWQIAPLLLCAVLGLALGVPEFFQGAFQVSGRFARESTSLLALLEPRHVADLGAAWTAAQGGLCAWGLVCERFPQGYSATGTLTGSAWLHASFVLGAALMALLHRGRGARLAGVMAVLWLGLLAYWSALAIHLLRAGPLAPLYFYLPLYPLLGLLSIYPLKALAGALGPLLPWQAVRSRGVRSAAVLFLGGALLASAFAWSRAREARPLSEPRSSLLVDELRREIALHPGQPFRGSVATILGVGQPPTGRDDFEARLDEVYGATGTSHALVDLWWHSIPTLGEYGQAITFPLRAYAQRVLRNPGDPEQPHFVAATRIEPRLLEILGVRFVLTDGAVPGAALRGELPLSGARRLRLYELAAPNLGGVSPTRVVAGKGADEVFAAIAADPGMLRDTAFTASAVTEPLVPARTARMRFERGGVAVSAQSGGLSALLLPVQFSNCLSLEQSGGAPVRILRANLLHTLLVFRGSIDLAIRWSYEFGASADCRLKDAAEFKALGLHG